MILLDKSHYNKVAGPLRQVTINCLFARSVVERKVSGQIFVDNLEHPETFYVIHPYGMTLLFGRTDNALFNAAFKRYALNAANTRDRHEWMQAFPAAWIEVLAHLFKDVMISSKDNIGHLEKGIVELNTRVNFKFNLTKYRDMPAINSSPEIRLLPADGALLRAMKGTVVPSNFWDNEADLLRNGLAYALIYKGELASMAFSSFCFDHTFELSIETRAEFRGMGFAEMVCRAIIDHCITQGYEPIWSCRLENVGSYKLALKLGFDPIMEWPYYRLSN